MNLRTVFAWVVTWCFTLFAARGEDGGPRHGSGLFNPNVRNAIRTMSEGQEIFRYDTFGDEAFWGGQLRLHETVRNLTPAQVLGLGLKVDSRSLSPRTLRQIREKTFNVNDSNNTIALLKADAVVGVKGFLTGNNLTSIGITCALCHSVVDDSVAPGIGRRLDGWANRDLNVGAIVASAPTLAPFAELLQVDEATVRTVLLAWGPGKFDAELSLDGKGFRPDGKTAATLIPPAFGLAGVNLHTWTGWVRSPIGTHSWRTSRCTARVLFTIRV